MSKSYSDSLSFSNQIDAEEMIAGIIWDVGSIRRETCSDLSRSILFAVLNEFRPDLIKKTEEDEI